MRLLLAALLLLPALALAQDEPITEACNLDNDGAGFFYGELIVESPGDLAGSYVAGGMSNNGAAVWGDTTALGTGVDGEVVIARSPGGTVDPDNGAVSDPDEACEDLTNTDDIAGKIALIRRGFCPFSDKALRVQEAGAIGFIVYQDERESATDYTLVNMNAVEGSGPLVTIPGVFAARFIGEPLVSQIEDSEVVVTAEVRYACCYTDAQPCGLSNEENVIPGVRELSAARPNPFTTHTQFDLALDQPQRVSVRAYDVLGREVATLYDGFLPTGTGHPLRFEAGGLSAGTYLVRVTGETFAQTRRVVLTR